MKFKLTLKANWVTQGGEVELDGDKIAAGWDVTLPGDFNPNKSSLWVIGNEYGALCAVWADCEQDALDNGVDNGWLDSFLVPSEDLAKMDESEREDLTFLGNAGEAANLDYAWMAEVIFDPTRDLKLIIALARANGREASTLD